MAALARSSLSLWKACTAAVLRIPQPTAPHTHRCVTRARPPRPACASPLRSHHHSTRLRGSRPVILSLSRSLLSQSSLPRRCPSHGPAPQPTAPHSHDDMGYARPPHAAQEPPPSHHRNTNSGSCAFARSRALFFVEAWQPTAFAERNSVLPPSPPSVLSSMAPAHSSAVPPSVASGIRCHATRSSLACHIRHPHPPAPPHRRYSSFPSPAYMVEDATPATRSSLFRASLSLFLPLAPRSPVSLPTSVDTD